MIQLPEFRGMMKRQFSLAPLTTWKIGGQAEVFVTPYDFDDLLYLLSEVKSKGIPLFVIGCGSNLLIDNIGIPGITLKLGKNFQYMDFKENSVLVGASCLMPSLTSKAVKNGFSGFGFMIGIPGTVGAGVVINAGKGSEPGQDIQSVLETVSFIDSGLNYVTKLAEDLKFGYRTSSLIGSQTVVIESSFRLNKSENPANLRVMIREILSERRKKFPLNLPNAGSIFKRPLGFPPAGLLIETAGLKGTSFGNAQVSKIHANFIVNMGNATSEDIKGLIKIVQEKVYKVHKVFLEPEIIFWPEMANW